MTFLQIRYFLEVKKQKSFTKAAAALFVSEQAVNKQVKSLEKELGCRLFYVENHKLSLSPAGEILFPIWAPLIKRTDAALERIQKEQDPGSRTLRIGVLEYGFVMDLVMPVLAEYGKAHPQVQVEILSGNPRHLMDYARDGRVDFILTWSAELPDSLPMQSVYHIHQLHLGLIFSANHPLAEKEDVTLSDFKDDYFFLLEKNHSLQAQNLVMSHCRALGFEPSVKYFSSPESIEINLMHQRGVSLAFLELYRNSGNHLRFLPIPDAELVSTIHLCLGALDAKHVPIAKELSKMLLAAMQER